MNESPSSSLLSSSLSPIKFVAGTVGANEAAIRIILTLLCGYPLAIVYNYFIVNRDELIKKSFFILAGFSLGIFNHGYAFLHTTLTIFIVYLVLKYFGGSTTSVGFTFTFCLGYLLYGYSETQINSSEYSFEWTIPHCVLTLRLIAIAFDLYDGQRIKDKRLSSSNEPIKNDTPIFEPPELLDLFSCCYFPFSFMVGPQFDYKRFKQFLTENENVMHICTPLAMIKLGLGLIYLFVHAVGDKYLPPSLMLSKYFNESGFFWRFTIIAAVTKIQCCKYIAIWLLAEGSLILSGFTYIKESRTFAGYHNVDPYLFETTPNFGGLIRSFNISTNQWSGKYLFKRLKFLGNKVASHALTLFFLAIWHGWKSGYYITFGMEFLIMKMEWEVLGIVQNIRQSNGNVDQLLSNKYIHLALMTFFHIYTVYMFGYCLISFTLLSYKKWFPVLARIYFAGHVFYISWIFVSPYVRSLFRPPRSRSASTSRESIQTQPTDTEESLRAKSD